MIILDTNVLVGIFDDTDPHHERAKALVRKLTEPIAIPEYVFIETLTVIAKRATPEHVKKFIDFVTMDTESAYYLPTGSEFLIRCLILFNQINSKKLSFIDTTLLYLSTYHQIITFDENLAKAIAVYSKK